MNGKFVKTKDDSDELLQGATKNEVNSVSLCFNRGDMKRNISFPTELKKLGEKSSLGYGSLKTLKQREIKEKMWAEKGEVAHFHWYASLIIFSSRCCCRRCCCYNRSHFDSKLTVVNNFPFKHKIKARFGCLLTVINPFLIRLLFSDWSRKYRQLTRPQWQLHKLGKIKGEISTHAWIYVCLLSIWGAKLNTALCQFLEKL